MLYSALNISAISTKLWVANVGKSLYILLSIFCIFSKELPEMHIQQGLSHKISELPPPARNIITFFFRSKPRFNWCNAWVNLVPLFWYCMCILAWLHGLSIFFTLSFPVWWVTMSSVKKTLNQSPRCTKIHINSLSVTWYAVYGCLVRQRDFQQPFCGIFT